MQTIRDGYRSAHLLMELGADKLIALLCIGLALYLGGHLSALTG